MTPQPEHPVWESAPRPVMPDHWTMDGNAFALLGHAQQAQKVAGWTPAQRNAWHEEATSGDYDHLLQTILAWHDQEDPNG